MHSKELQGYVDLIFSSEDCEQTSFTGLSKESENILYRIRWLTARSIGFLHLCSRDAKQLDALEAATLFTNARYLLETFDESLKPPFHGISTLSDLQDRSNQVKEIISQAIALCYGQIFYRENAESSLVIDSGVKERIRGETHEIKKLIERTIEDFEKRATPNLILQPLIGLIEDYVRKMSHAWDPKGPKNYTSEMLWSLQRLCNDAKKDLRINEAEAQTDKDRELEAEWLLKKLHHQCCLGVSQTVESLTAPPKVSFAET